MSLKRRIPLRRTGGPRRKRALARIYREDPVLTQSRKVVRRRSGGKCEAKTSRCVGTAQHAHHIEPRRFGDHSPSNLLDVCHACHAWVHSHPARSYELGLLKRGNR